MKLFKHLLSIVLLFITVAAMAQTETPKGFASGSIELTDGSTVTGFVKDNMRKEAAVFFVGVDGKKAKYPGTDLQSANIGGTKYMCIKGDFFKVVCNGEICFLQKSSDASSIPVYNGSEAMFINGTEGKPGDYFIYSGIDKQLKKVSKATVETVAAKSFAGCTAAIDKAKAAKEDISKLKDAVEIFNNRNK
jgi:hypothetical protein